MDNIYLDFYAFFTPCRLVWDHWKEFMGENSTSAGIPATTYSIPVVEDPDETGVESKRLGDYFGLPIGDKYWNGNSADPRLQVSALPGRCYFLIYNEWFRNQNVIAPFAVQKGDTNELLVGDINGGQFGYDLPLVKASKIADYFVKALPYAQKGSAVTLPLGTTAPIILQDLAGGAPSAGSASVSVTWSGSSTETQAFATSSGGAASMYADLQNATAAPINLIRYAFQLQKALEKDALYGSRYWEILAAHFGIKAPDASLQRPEYLGGYRQRINIDQVLTTSGYDDTSLQEVGKPGANSVTGGKFSLFTKSFTEHGYLMIIAVARHDQTYCQGVNRMWSRKNRFDFYFPVFANLGAQEVKKKEIYAQGTTVDDEVFGYQEAWAEYRYKPSIASGLLNPNVSGSLDFWTLANKFAALPTLGQAFIEQGRDNIKRALTTGNTGPDFIADFYFEDIAVRPMPMYSIPGLVDHH